MSESLKSLSQVWNKKQDPMKESIDNQPSTSRRQLSRQFTSVSDTQQRMPLRSRNVLSSINLNVASMPKETKKLIQAGAEKVRSTLDSWSQVCLIWPLLL